MQNKKGFTLLELIVAMAIIAVLMGLSLYGIRSVQMSQRDTERRAALSNINLEIAAYYGDNGSYPTVTFNVTNSTVTVGSKPAITLKGAAKIIKPADGKSSENGTVYCYTGAGGSTYGLGVYLEGPASWGSVGTAQQLGNAASACSTVSY